MKKYFILLFFVLLSSSLFSLVIKPHKIKLITEEVGFYDKKIKQSVNYGFVKFLKSVNSNYAEFTQSANFNSAEFTGPAIFLNTKFSDTSRFTFSLFRKYAAFNLSQFFSNADFSGIRFLDTASFIDTRFLKGVNFTSTKFTKGGNFFGTLFSGDVIFNDVEFQKHVKFSGAGFFQSVDFSSAIFHQESTFDISYLSFSDKTKFYFNQTLFPDTIIFANNNVTNDIYFTNADFTSASTGNTNRQQGKRINIYLLNTNISKIHIDYIHFKLLLPDSTFQEDGNKTKAISFEEKAAVYEALLNNFKTNGQTESYKLLDIEYQEFKWHNGLWTNHLAWLPKFWWNFGYDKEYIFLWTALFLIVFTCFTYFFIYSLNTKIYIIDKIPVNIVWQKKMSFRDFIKRLWFSFMYTSTVFFKLSVDIKNLEFKERRGTFYIIVVYTIGLVCIAYMANFVLQKT